LPPAFAKSANKKVKFSPPLPEFSRLVNIGQIPPNRPVLCKILAKEKERNGLEKRFDIFKLEYFAANVTISRQNFESILVEGRFEAHIKSGRTMRN